MRWLFDPLHRLPKRTQWVIYAVLAAHAARLAAWYYIEDTWGEP